MQVAPIRTVDPEINEIRTATANIVNRYIIPNEDRLGEHHPDRPALAFEISEVVKKAGLWAPHLPKEYGGMGIGFLKHAYMNEILAWSPYSGVLFGVAPPDFGNQVLLTKHGTPEQKRRWLEPLARGEIRSCFSMTEPDAPGSNPYGIQTRAVRDGDEWVINGRKWFSSGAQGAAFAIVMCRTEEADGAGGAREKMTQIIVPTDTPGFNIIRSVPVWGGLDGNHCEIVYDNVRVPVTNQIGATGTGHQAAQDRLGPGRVLYAMNCIGQMWRAFDLMVHRSIEREVHGGKLETKQFIHGFIADSYMDIQSSRLMTLRTAELIEHGEDARTDISAIKVFVPAALLRVTDRAIQVHGAMGISGDTPLIDMYIGARTMRIADGPDEVHRIVIAKNVLKRYHEGTSWDFGL